VGLVLLEDIWCIPFWKKINSNVIVFSSGGLIEKFCLENNIEYRKIQQYHSPRASFTAFLYGILKILGPILPIEDNEINESINELKKLSVQISSKNMTKDNPSLQLAKWISNIPLIYYPSGFKASAIRFKNSIQENAKMHAISEDVIEACHNGIVSWEKPTDFRPILIRGADDHEKTKERWEILKEFFDDICTLSFFNSFIDSLISFSSIGNIGPNIFNIPYKKAVNDALGE